MKIREREYPSGRRAWQLDAGFILRDGKKVRYQKSFLTRGAAEAEEKRLRGMQRKNGAEGLALSAGEIARFAHAERQLRSAGMTIEEAVRVAMLHGVAVTRAVTLAELVRDFVATRRRRGCSVRYERALGVSLGGFLRGREAMQVTLISRADVEGWLFSHGWSAVTIGGYAGDLRTMFNWAVREKFLMTSPAVNLELPRSDVQQEISVLSVAQCDRLLQACVAARGPVWLRGQVRWTDEQVPLYHELLGYLAAAMFCGVRPEEIARGKLEDLDLAGGTLVIRGEAAKTARRRVIELSENAGKWFRVWRKLCPLMDVFCGKNFRKKWERLRGAAGLVPWPQDVLRHTFATMHFALHRDTARLKSQMGHHEAEGTLDRHYRAVKLPDGKTISKQMAEKFWELVPPQG